MSQTYVVGDAVRVIGPFEDGSAFEETGVLGKEGAIALVLDGGKIFVEVPDFPLPFIYSFGLTEWWPLRDTEVELIRG
jgi:hypothetical protein